VIEWLDDGSFRLAPEWFRPPQKGYISYDKLHRPLVPLLYTDRAEQVFGKAREPQEPLSQHHKNMAASVQKMLEQTLFHILRHLHEATGLKTLCLAGGVAQNSVANGKITRNSPFERVYIPNAGHDAGLAMGAGMYLHHHILGNPRLPAVTNAYTGGDFSDTEIALLLQRRQVPYRHLTNRDALYNAVADCLVSGGVVGWFRGRSEFGPRALGHRSILADPRRADAKDLLNRKIKRRESFRPFAPSILREFTGEYFEVVDDVPFMEKVFPIRPEKRGMIPAVTHVDGTGRLQTVSQDTSPDFYGLIKCFHNKTGIPVVLNTSFNENEPIVNSPSEALACFERTEMDMLVLGDYLITRQAPAYES
jgi:carbamoyltransferase